MNSIQIQAMHILVPKPNNVMRKLIKAGSGIVAADRPDGSADIYFEGNLYGAEDLETYSGQTSVCSRQAFATLPKCRPSC